MRSLLLLVLLLSGCMSMPARNLTSEEQGAVGVAEVFVMRNGYTVAGHPADVPVQHVSIFDVFESDDELIKNRRGLLEARAIAVEQKAPGVFWVYFEEAARKDSPRIVYVRDGEALQLFHQSYGPPGKEAVPVTPPNVPSSPALKRTSLPQARRLASEHSAWRPTALFFGRPHASQS